MHYITGTSFIVRQQANIWDKQFNLNTPYSLFSITQCEGGFKYMFKAHKHTTEIVFESCKQADDLIARHKKEKLPDYQAHYQRSFNA